MPSHNSIKPLIGFVTLLFVVWTLSNTHLVESTQASQQEDRQLNKRSWRDEPVLIKFVRTKKGIVKLDEKFADGDDWFQGLTLRMDNRSAKIITYIEVSLIFRRPLGETGLPLAYSIKYNFASPRVLGKESEVTVAITRPPVQPGQFADVTISDQQYDSIRSLLRQAGYSAS